MIYILLRVINNVYGCNRHFNRLLRYHILLVGKVGRAVCISTPRSRNGILKARDAPYTHRSMAEE
jgi:hypothetical protein